MFDAVCVCVCVLLVGLSFRLGSRRGKFETFCEGFV